MRFESKELKPFTAFPTALKLVGFIESGFVEAYDHMLVVRFDGGRFPVYKTEVLAKPVVTRIIYRITADPIYEAEVRKVLQFVESRYTELATRYIEHVFFKTMEE